MSKLRRLWQWLLNPDNRATLALLGGATVTVIGGAWALYPHLSKSLTSKITPPVTGVHIVGNITAGRDVVIQNIQTTPEQFDTLLQKRLKEVMAQIPQADPQQRALLERELAAIQAKYDNLQKAFEEQKARLTEVYQALDKFKQEVPAGQIEQAQKALARGETGAAETLFKEVLEKSTKEAEKPTAEAAAAAYQLGGLAESRIDYGQAVKYYRLAVQLQPDNPAYLNAAGTLSRTLGHYQESEQLLKRALELRGKSLKPEDSKVAESLNNLAVLYQNQGKYGEAESLYRGAQSIYEKTLGPGHPYVATSLNNLAGLYQAQGKYKEAEPLYLRALTTQEKVLGPDDPHVAAILSNLAVLYKTQGKYGEAEQLYRRALAIDKRSLGPEHPDVATDLNNLALLYGTQRRYGEVEPLIKQSLAIREKTLGPEHPYVGVSLNNLAVLYKIQGKYVEAEPLYQRALAIQENSLGPEHPDLAIGLENYAALLKKMGRGAEAALLSARAQAIRAKQAEKNPQR